MTNFNNRDLSDRTVSQNQTPATDLSENMTQRPAARNQTAYQDGYWQGRYTEQQNNASRRAYDEENAANGAIFGILLASLVGLGLGTYFYLSSQNRAPQVVPNVTAPSPAPVPAQSPEVRERIIERDRIVPVPQQAPAPDVNITVPNPAPVAPRSEVTQPAPAPAPDPQSSPTTPQPEAPVQTGGQ